MEVISSTGAVILAIAVLAALFLYGWLQSAGYTGSKGL